MTPRQRALDRLARADHGKGCRNEPPFEAMTISHAMVHEHAAIRAYNRLPAPSRDHSVSPSSSEDGIA